MEKFTETLQRVGVWCSKNKYLSSISAAFQNFMPFIIIGAIGVLWSNVIVNSSTGLGALVPAIMGLSFLNPAFDALNFATIGCITVGVTLLLGQEIGSRNGIGGAFAGFLAFACLLTLIPTSMAAFTEAGEATALGGLSTDILGSTCMFTGMIAAILSVELFTVLFKIDGLKLKMPDHVPPGVSRSFEYLIPGFLTMVIFAVAGRLIQMATGAYVNELIYNAVQTPLQGLGASLPGLLIFELIALLFWCVGLHGDNMIGGVFMPLMTALSVENMNAVAAGQPAPYIVNWSFARIVYATGGTGLCIGLTIAILLFGKREDNRTIAKIAIVPNMFNIMEVNMFGLPMVLNPILLVPFVIAPIVSTIIAYVLSVIGIMPVIYLNLPWTMPPFLYAFLGSGGNFIAGLIHIGLIVLAVFIYAPFVMAYERQQNAMMEEE